MENEQLNQTALVLDSKSTAYLKETAKWSKILAALGYVFTAIMVIAGLAVSIIFSFLPIGDDLPFPGFLLGLIYIVMGGIYFFPIYYLYNFADKMNVALKKHKENELQTAFKNLKSHYKFIGILTIAIGSLYIFGIVIFIIISSIYGF